MQKTRIRIFITELTPLKLQKYLLDVSFLGTAERFQTFMERFLSRFCYKITIFAIFMQ